MRLLWYLHKRTSIFIKVLVANAIIVVVGSFMAVWVSGRVARGLMLPSAEALFIGMGLLVTVGINYAILWVAFQPLVTMQGTLDRVRRGDFSARVPEVEGDPAIERVIETANLMLDRLAEHRQAVAAQILRAQEEERKRIARELHDETSQSLTSVLVNLEAVEKQVPDLPDEVFSRLRLTKEIAQRTLDETRRLMFDLRPSVLDDLGLIPALRWFISQRVHPHGLEVDFEAIGLEARLPEELETALFRIMQEAITNAVKHAKAKLLRVKMTREPGCIYGAVVDDGIGFHPVHVIGKSDKERGLGLFGMQERATLVGGSVQVESAPGLGTSVRVTVPDRVGGKATGV